MSSICAKTIRRSRTWVTAALLVGIIANAAGAQAGDLPPLPTVTSTAQPDVLSAPPFDPFISAISAGFVANFEAYRDFPQNGGSFSVSYLPLDLHVVAPGHHPNYNSHFNGTLDAVAPAGTSCGLGYAHAENSNFQQMNGVAVDCKFIEQAGVSLGAFAMLDFNHGYGRAIQNLPLNGYFIAVPKIEIAPIKLASAIFGKAPLGPSILDGLHFDVVGIILPPIQLVDKVIGHTPQSYGALAYGLGYTFPF